MTSPWAEQAHSNIFCTRCEITEWSYRRYGNPFTEDSSGLLLNTRNIADIAVANTVQQIEQLGIKQYEAYVEDRLVKQSTPILDPIKRNNLHLFSRPPLKGKSNKQQQISSLKNNCSLFSRLCITSQVHDGDLDEFF